LGLAIWRNQSVFQDPMLAYLDPTSGSMGFQLLVASLLAGITSVRLYWTRLKSVFRHKRKLDS